MQKCIRENGAVLSSAFAKLGIVIPVTASILFLGEIPTLFQLVGIVLVIVAIWVINSEGDRGCGRRRRMGSAGLLLVLFVVSGMADGMSKVTERIGERRFDALFLFYTFLTALVLTVVLAFLEQQRTRRKIGKMDFLSGVAVGFPNYFSTSLLLASVSRLPAFIVYPSFSVGTILVVSFVSVLVLGTNQPETDWGMRDYFGGVGAAESLGFSVSDAALIIKDILLHYPCVSFIASKKSWIIVVYRRLFGRRR